MWTIPLSSPLCRLVSALALVSGKVPGKGGGKGGGGGAGAKVNPSELIIIREGEINVYNLG